MELDDPRRTTARRWALVAVKSVHTLIWVLVEAAVGYLLFAGVTKRSDRWAATAGVAVVAESIVYLVNGARCPLTGAAESLGAESGSVTDIYLPRWLARNLPVIHIPLLALMLVLHRKVLISRFRIRTN
jgi:hypothetical protein